MNEKQIALVQNSYAHIAPVSDVVASIFYDRLFEIAPETRSLFKGNMGEQGGKLMATLGVAVKGLTNLEAIVPVVEELARKHLDYGVSADHYESVGAALLHALEHSLGSAFSAEIGEAWASAYSILSSAMISAAYGEVAA